jgi:hypothetical protein
MLPQADVYPAGMRATRDLLRRRMPLLRHPASLLAHLQKTHSQDNLPQLGQKLADKANRQGVAERFPDPAVQKRLAGDLTRSGSYDRRLTELALAIVDPAMAHEAQTFSRLRSIPGVDNILAHVLLYAIHGDPPLPPGADVRLRPSSGDVRQSIRRHMGWHGRGQDRPRGPPVGLLGSRRPVFPAQAGGPKIPCAPRDNTWPGHSLDGPRPSPGARRELPV